jgi:hypothetical protein
MSVKPFRMPLEDTSNELIRQSFYSARAQGTSVPATLAPSATPTATSGQAPRRSSRTSAGGEEMDEGGEG